MSLARSNFDAGRRRFALALLGLAIPPIAKAAPCPPPTVLFVCPYGTVKSAIAREILKARAAAAGVPVRVQSRGLQLADHVSPALAASLRTDGIDPRAEPARQLQPADPAQATIVVAFDEAAQAPLLHGARVWDIPSWNSDYAGAKAALAERVDALLGELAAQPRDGCPEAGR